MIRIVEKRYRRKKKHPEISRLSRKISFLRNRYLKERENSANPEILRRLEKRIEELKGKMESIKDTKENEQEQIGLDRYVEIEEARVMTVSEFRKYICRKCDDREKCQQTKARILKCAERK